jgi:hypothetical protein
MSIENTVETNPKKHGKLNKWFIATPLAALALGGGVLALSQSGSTESPRNNQPKTELNSKKTHTSTPKKTKTPNTTSTPTVSVATSNLCAVPAINTAVEALVTGAGDTSTLTCKDTSSSVNPSSVAIGVWHSNGEPTLYTAIIPNKQTKSYELYPANSNLWQHDVNSVKPNKPNAFGVKQTLLPDAINNLPAIWDYTPNSTNPSYAIHGLEFKYGSDLVVIGTLGLPSAAESSYVGIGKLVIEDAFN